MRRENFKYLNQCDFFVVGVCNHMARRGCTHSRSTTGQRKCRSKKQHDAAVKRVNKKTHARAKASISKHVLRKNSRAVLMRERDNLIRQQGELAEAYLKTLGNPNIPPAKRAELSKTMKVLLDKTESALEEVETTLQSR